MTNEPCLTVRRLKDEMFSWTVQGELGERVVRAIQEWRRDPSRGVVLREKKHRKLFRVQIDEEHEALVKHIMPSGWRASWKESWLRSTAEKEWRILRYFQARSIPAPVPLAVGHGRSLKNRSESWLATLWLPGVSRLSDIMRNPAEARLALLATVRLIRTLHENGVYHQDLHAENVLISDRKDAPKVFIVDVHRVMRLPALPRPFRQANLAQFLYSIRTTLPADLSFGELIREYLGGNADNATRAWEVACAKFLRRHLHRHFRSRMRHELRSGNHARWARMGSLSVFHVPEVDETFLSSALSEHHKALRAAGSSIGKVSKRVAVTLLEARIDKKQRPICVKEWRRPPMKDRLAVRLKIHRAFRAWRNARGLAFFEIPTPRPLALAVDEGGDGAVYLICERDPSVAGVDKVFLSEFAVRPRGDVFRRKMALIEKVAALFRSLQKHGVEHRDLKSSNILARPAADGWCVSLIDCDDIRFHRSLTRSQWAKALAQLNASMPRCATITDRVRFLRLCSPDLDQQAFRQLLRDVMSATSKRTAVWDRYPEYARSLVCEKV